MERSTALPTRPNARKAAFSFANQYDDSVSRRLNCGFRVRQHH